jgi:hypothetical protein
MEVRAMSPTKESLLQAVEGLSEEEARRALAYINSLHAADERTRVRARLTSHPAIRVPSEDADGFREFTPIQCTGIPASELLIRDRR